MKIRNIKIIQYNLYALKKNWWAVFPILKAKIMLKDILEKFSLIHANSLWSAIIVSKFIKNKPIICWVHSFVNIKRKGKRVIFKFFKKPMLANIDKFIVVSKKLRQNLIELGIKENKILLIYNGIKINNCKEGVSGILKNNSDQFRIGIVARIHPGKGQHLLIQAISILNRKEPNKFKVFIIGEEFKTEMEDLNFTEHLKKLVKKEGLSGNVHFLSFKEDIFSILQELDIVVLPSKEESFGLSLLEAMSCKKPVIASNVGGIPELVKDNFNGFLLKTFEAKELAERIYLLYKDKALYKRLANNAYEYAKKFSIEKHIKELRRVYDSYLK